MAAVNYLLCATREPMKLKCVIIWQTELEVPLVFFQWLFYGDLAGKHNVASAGFCELAANGKWRAGGHSTSLKLNARPQDAEILSTHL